jgi:hypothetical protein
MQALHVDRRVFASPDERGSGRLSPTRRHVQEARSRHSAQTAVRTGRCRLLPTGGCLRARWRLQGLWKIFDQLNHLT